MPQRQSSPVKFPVKNGLICDCIVLTLFNTMKEKAQFFNFDRLQGKKRSVHSVKAPFVRFHRAPPSEEFLSAQRMCRLMWSRAR